MSLTLTKTPLGRSETDLVAAARGGDDGAFAELYAQYRKRIYGFILSRVRDHGRAEDIAQEVFISALRRLRASDQTIAFKPWIYEIAKNACIDEFRRGGRSREAPLETDGEFRLDWDSTVSEAPTPSSVVEGKQQLEDLRGAFGGLSDNHRRLLVMREFEGLSYEEIGRRLDMSRQMVESTLFRARRKLADEYQELASGRRCQQVQAAIEAGELRSARSLGLRSRRLFARHLSHCQPCRHVALLAEVDEALVQRRGVAAKIAALLPFGLGRWLLRRWSTGGSSSAQAATAVGHSAAPAIGLVPTAAAGVAALVAAGAGIGIGHAAGGHASHPAVRLVPAAAHSTSVGPAAARRTAGTRASGAGSRAAAAAPARPRTAARLHLGAASHLQLGTGGASSSHHGSGSAAKPGSAGSPAGSGGSPAPSGSSAGTAPGGTRTSTPIRSGITDGVQRVGGAVGSVVSSVPQTVTNTVSNTVSGVQGTVTNTVSGVTHTVSNLTQGVANTVTSAAGVLQNPSSAVPQTVSNAANTVTSTVTGVTNTAAGVLSGVGQTVTSAAGATGPLGSALSQATSALGAK